RVRGLAAYAGADRRGGEADRRERLQGGAQPADGEPRSARLAGGGARGARDARRGRRVRRCGRPARAAAAGCQGGARRGECGHHDELLKVQPVAASGAGTSSPKRFEKRISSGYGKKSTTSPAPTRRWHSCQK